jgi:hypothetical protein
MSQQRTLFDHLDAPALQRAISLPLFADSGRLARKPRCSDTKTHSVIRTAPHALSRPYIQPNAPTAYYRLVFDLDWHQDGHPLHELPVRFLNDHRAWEKELGVPSPSWAAVSPGKNSAHIGYELETPVGRHAHARVQPQRYLAAVETAMALKLQADAGFSGALCKNPVNEAWELYQGSLPARSLGELADYLDLTPAKVRQFNREPRGETGRNVYLFDEVRFWAYDNIEAWRAAGFEAWEQAVLRQSEALNATGFAHLPSLTETGLLPASECRSVAKSVAKWVWANHGRKTLTKAFSELQAWRGARGAAKAASVKRERRETAILDAIGQLTAQGQIATMNKVAELLVCSKGGLSQHYRHLFQGTAH